MSARDNPLADSDFIRRSALSKVSGDPAATLADLQIVSAIFKDYFDESKDSYDVEHQAKLERSESVRFWVPVIASLASVLILALTLWSQSRQFESTARLQDKTLRAQLDSNEDTAWRESIKIFADKPGTISSASGVAALEQFMDSSRHSKDARRLAVSLLGQGTFAPAFKVLFDTAYSQKFVDEKGTSTILEELVQLNRQLNQVMKQLETTARIMDGTKGPLVPDFSTDPQKPVLVPRGYLVQKTVDLENEVNTEERLVSAKISELASIGKGMSGLDLAGTRFVLNSMKGFDLSGSNLDQVEMFMVDLQDANLKDASAADLGEWQGVRWWKAKQISPDLLALLRRKYGFPKGEALYNGSTKEEYEQDNIRLDRVQ